MRPKAANPSLLGFSLSLAHKEAPFERILCTMKHICAAGGQYTLSPLGPLSSSVSEFTDSRSIMRLLLAESIRWSWGRQGRSDQRQRPCSVAAGRGQLRDTRNSPQSFLRISEKKGNRKTYRGTLIATVGITAISAPPSSPLSPLRRLHHLDVRDTLDRAQSLFRRVHLLFDSAPRARYAFERDDVLVCEDPFSYWSHVAQRGGGGV